jgi:hypothetical protein
MIIKAKFPVILECGCKGASYGQSPSFRLVSSSFSFKMDRWSQKIIIILFYWYRIIIIAISNVIIINQKARNNKDMFF